MEPIILVNAADPERKPWLYACGKCGQVHSPRIYACGDDRAHKAAREAATNCYHCRTHNICHRCGAECEKHWLACGPCRTATRLEKMERIAPDQIGGYCVSFLGEDYYPSVEEAAEAGHTMVHPTTFETFSINADRLIEYILDGHHEDASVSDLKGVDELLAAVETFNKSQTLGTYNGDFSKVADLSAMINDLSKDEG